MAKLNKLEFIVGCFMLAGMAAAVILALKVAGLTFSSYETSVYHVTGKFDNIGSLKIRAPVKIGGVVIGRVSDIYIDHNSLVPVVKMEINKKYDNLSSESKASILTAGLIGEQYIGIAPGFYDEDMGTTYLTEGSVIKDTGSAIVLEELIGKFLYSVKGDDNSDKKADDSNAKTDNSVSSTTSTEEEPKL